MDKRTLLGAAKGETVLRGGVEDEEVVVAGVDGRVNAGVVKRAWLTGEHEAAGGGMMQPSS